MAFEVDEVVVAGGEPETGLANILEPEVLRIEAKAFEVLVAAPEPEKGDVEGVREKGPACRVCQKTLLKSATNMRLPQV